jgi:hypothetical protein
MKLSINLDYDLEAGDLLLLTGEIRGAIKNFFIAKEYGSGMSCIAIIINCRPSYLNHKLRKRFDKKSKVLYMDVMNNFEIMCELSEPDKLDLVTRNFYSSIESIKGYKKKIVDFDFDSFEKDWEILFDLIFSVQEGERKK